MEVNTICETSLCYGAWGQILLGVLGLLMVVSLHHIHPLLQQNLQTAVVFAGFSSL